MEDGDHRNGKLVSSAHFVGPGSSAGPNTMMKKSGLWGFISIHTVTAAVVKTRPEENLIFCVCLCARLCVCVCVFISNTSRPPKAAFPSEPTDGFCAALGLLSEGRFISLL